MRVGIVGLQHESNTFQSTPTTWEHFEQGALLTGQDIVREYGAAHHEISGYLQGLDEEGLQVVPVFFAWAMPGGVVTARTLDRLLAGDAGGTEKRGPTGRHPGGAARGGRLGKPPRHGRRMAARAALARRAPSPDRRHGRPARQSLAGDAAGHRCLDRISHQSASRPTPARAGGGTADGPDAPRRSPPDARRGHAPLGDRHRAPEHDCVALPRVLRGARRHAGRQARPLE